MFVVAVAVVAAALAITGVQGQANCTSYCTEIQTNCAGANEQYPSQAECETACGHAMANGMVQGTPAATSGNSLECRFYHAGVASGDPVVHCPHAGITGGGACGLVLENWMAFSGACGFPSSLPPNPEGAIPNGTSADTSGNTVGCRLYHTGVAMRTDPVDETHCGHAATPSAGDACGTTGAGYCDVYMSACVGNVANPFADVAGCQTYVTDTAMPVGYQSNISGNSLNCRSYHSYAALQLGAATHCPHASPGGGGAGGCGTYCENYCQAWMAVCQAGSGASSYPGYTDAAACATACAGWTVGTAGATDGASTQCRLYHTAVAAMSTGADRTLHCGHSSSSGDGVCVAAAGATGSTEPSGAATLAAGALLTTAAIAAL